jgi:hypothetical protein
VLLCVSDYFISETTEQICIKFGSGSLRLKLSDECSFLSYPPNTSPHLCESEIELRDSAKNSSSY